MENRIFATFTRNIFLSFMILLTLTSVISLQMQEAYAVPPTLSAAITGAVGGNSSADNQIVVTFSVDVNATATDTVAAWSVAGFSVASVSDLLQGNCDGSEVNIITITLTTSMPTDATPQVTYNDAAGITIDNCTDEPLAGANISPTDGLKPTVSISVGSLNPSEDSSVTFTWSETVTDYLVGDLLVSAGTLSGFAGAGASYSVTWNLSGAPLGSSSITVATNSVVDGNANTGPASATAGSLARLSEPGSGCRGDCSAPTLGVNENGIRVVENGFTYNGNQINVERFFTPYPLITVDVGKQNKAVFKIYDDLGPNNIQHFDFAFGLDEGQVMGTSNAMIVWNKSTDGTETVTLVDPHNALDKVRVLTSEGKCRADSTTNDCLIVTVFHTFRESLDFDIVGTNVWDFRLNAWQNFYNHGIHIEGQSLNPPDEYVGIYKGNLIHLIETGKNTAVDTDGNTWTFDNTWIKDYISIGKIDDPITSQGYDRNHVKYNTYKQGQELVASSLFETYYKTSISQEPAFSEIDDIKFYEYPDTIDKKFDPVLLAKMHQEDIRAQKYLEEMFAKMYPGIIYD